MAIDNNQKPNQGQFNQNQQDQQGGMKKTGVGQQPSQGQQGTTKSQPINNPNVRK